MSIAVEPLAHPPRAGQEPAERREYSRFEAPLIIVSGDWRQVVDISLTGACLEGRWRLPEAGDSLTLVLTDEADHHTAMIEAEVVWRHEHRAGIRWTAVDPAEAAWLEERCRPGRLVARGWLYTGAPREAEARGPAGAKGSGSTGAND